MDQVGDAVTLSGRSPCGPGRCKVVLLENPAGQNVLLGDHLVGQVGGWCCNALSGDHLVDQVGGWCCNALSGDHLVDQVGGAVTLCQGITLWTR